MEAGAEYAQTLSFPPEFYSSGTEAGGDFVQAADDIDADGVPPPATLLPAHKFSIACVCPCCKSGGGDIDADGVSPSASLLPAHS